jgi:hypothetical protein
MFPFNNTEALSTEQVEALSTEQVEVLSTERVEALSTEQVEVMPQEVEVVVQPQAVHEVEHRCFGRPSAEHAMLVTTVTTPN